MTAGSRIPLLIALLAAPGAAAGCMPWMAGETAETLRPGAVRVDLATSLLAPPARPAALLPVPELRVVAGVREGLDAGAGYVPPLTGHVRLRGRLVRAGSWAAAAMVGGGVHGVPDLLEADARFGVPFATTALQLSTRGAKRRWHGSVHGIAPMHFGDELVATLWLAPQVGVELGEGAFRWGGEVGVVIPTLHADRTQLRVGVSARWLSLP